MKIICIVLLAAGLSACAPNKSIDIDETEGLKESEFIENKNKAEEVINNTEKKPLDKMETENINPEPNEKPENLEEDDSSKISLADVNKLVVRPVANDSDDSNEEGLDANTIKKPKYKVKNSDHSGILNDVYLLAQDQELYEIEQEKNVNITIINTATSGQRVLVIPRTYNGMLKINEISYNEKKDAYDIGKEYLNVYMADQDAILLETELNPEKPNILLTYSDEEGNYIAQTFLRYSADKKQLTLDGGYNAAN